MQIPRSLVRWLTHRMNIPDGALDMFDAANRLSGLEPGTLPTELIPLNTLQLARGLLNFTVLQSLPDWVFPYWAERQFDPADASFVPRSHTGLVINVTHRNWTAIGEPGFVTEPCVDPRGLLTPFPNGWSVDIWLAVDGKMFFPSRSADSEQRLLHDIPIVETSFLHAGIRLTITAFVESGTLTQQVMLTNLTGDIRDCHLYFAFRPFNPEGVSLLRSLAFEDERRIVTIEGRRSVVVSRTPNSVCTSNFVNGDSAHLWATRDGVHSIQCDAGLANGWACFEVALPAAASDTVSLACALDGEMRLNATPVDSTPTITRWESLLNRGMSIETPDSTLNSTVKSSLATVLLLADGASITPGPSTYHQFWFRDAAYMLWALDKTGHAALADPIIRAFSDRQDRAGYFRSQRGEWDSNGQALWTVWQHTLFSHADTVAMEMFPALDRGMAWIEKQRLTSPQENGTPHCGLLPRGLSAEHLGLVDYYYWDNFWSAAGLRSFIRLCKHLGRSHECDHAEHLLATYWRDIARSIEHVQARNNIPCIPAGPYRGSDYGMVGSVAGLYPLELFSPSDPGIGATIATLVEQYFRNGLFFQNFIHSGLNPYLTLHVAHALLYAGERQKFWTMLNDVVARASPTHNYPEAIHPLTGGGVMGDGHHGWAAAEVVLAVRDAFVCESWQPDSDGHNLRLLAGLPEQWFRAGNEFALRNCPIPEGLLTLAGKTEDGSFQLHIEFERRGRIPIGKWSVELPWRIDAGGVESDGRTIAGIRKTEEGTVIDIEAASATFRFTRQQI